MAKSSLTPDEGSYAVLLNGLKARIHAAQIKAALAVNQELVMLYWQIGREILARQQGQKWGSKVLDRLAQDLKREFPDMKGFSRSNLKYMRAFAEAWPDGIGQAPLGQITWYHNIALLEKLKDSHERLWYAYETIENGWSRNILVAQIKSGLYQREGGAISNFERTLPAPQSDLAKQIVKNPYNFDFLTLSRGVQEQDFKRALVKHMRDFLLELGVGFSFVGHNQHLTVEGEDFHVDLLFYHLELRCFVVIELEMGDFQPEHSGRMNFYIAAVDGQYRKKWDQPTIGIILCQTKKKVIAEYALSNLRNPIAVAEHRLPDVLPSPERLQAEMENAVQMLEGGSETLEVNAQSDTITGDQQSFLEAASEIQRLLKLLEASNPDATEVERQAFVTAAIPLALRQRAMSAFDSIDRAAIAEDLQDAEMGVAVKVIESWQDT